MKLPLPGPVRRSLRLKLILVSIGVEVLMLALLVGNSLRLLNRAMDTEVRVRTQEIQPLLQAALAARLFQRDYVSTREILNHILNSDHDGLRYVVVLDAGGRVFASTSGMGRGKPLSAIDTSLASAVTDGVYDMAAPLRLGAENVGQVRYGLSLESFLDARDSLFRQGVLIAATEVLLTTLLLGLAGYLLTRHIGVLLRGTRAVSQGDYDVRLPLTSPDEVGQLTRDFNHMAESLRDRVAALRASEQALARANARLEAMIQAMGDPMVFADADRTLRLVNPAFTAVFGYSTEELIGQSGRRLYADPRVFDQLGEMRYRPDALSNGGIFDVEYRRRDGGVFVGETRATPVCDQHGTVLGFLAIIRDISDRKAAEKALFAEKERAQVTLASIGDGVITTDAAGRIDYLNPVAERLTGWTTGEARGRPLPEVFTAVDEVSGKPVGNPIEQCLGSGTIAVLAQNTVLVARGGEEFAIQDSAAPIRDGSGQVIGGVLVFHDVSKARQMARQLSHQAKHDALTGLVNRWEFEQQLAAAVESAREEGKVHALLYLDLDQFKVVNDTCGHVAGDELLRQLAPQIKHHIRSVDTLSRLGGDEFGVLLQDCPLQEGISIANELRQTVQDFRFIWEDRTFAIGVSIGLVPVTVLSANASDLLSAADVGCYQAKELGRNQVRVYQPGDEDLARRHGEMQWISRINRALEEDRFRLHCQLAAPVAGATSNDKPRYYEILIRMVGEDGRLIPPMAFMPAAERYNLMPAVDRWVVSHTFRQIASRGCTGGFVCAINVSGHTLGDGGFLDFVDQQLVESGVDPHCVAFEVTETAAITNLTRAIEFLSTFKARGCRFSLDDFGSGLSSFAYLKNFPVDYLKIDGAFVKDMVQDPMDHALVSAINQLGHIMGIATIAEFVEDTAILEALREVGVDYAQGFVVGQVISIEEMLESLSRSQSVLPGGGQRAE
ncbi:MAG: EAL domain-containing protein [Gammaproteobacteria bacterium]